MRNDLIGAAITKETRHPIWGELFKRVLAGELVEEDVYFAGGLDRPHPCWIGVIAGGNPRYLRDVASIALTDFLYGATCENEDGNRLEETCNPAVFHMGEMMDRDRLN
jgi:hypothetical protein